jgi:hypothetical protein
VGCTQAGTLATGFIVALPQYCGNGAIEIVGGFLTITVCVELNVPHEFVIVNLIRYEPDSTKLKFALAVVWFGIGVMLVPQKPAV